ncbi:MAG: ribonuclease H-like domain-containing protein [Pseudomonadota bacterium]
MAKPHVTVHRDDLPADLTFGGAVAVDTEALGLKTRRDRLCVVQLSGGDGTAHLVQIAKDKYDAPNLKRLLRDPDTTKIFHYARFDVAILKTYLGVETAPIYCTKIASKLVRTYTDRHGLKDLCSELAGVELSKQQQSSDWAAETLSDQQIAYAASDVLYLHKIKERLDFMLAREDRTAMATAAFDYLQHRVNLDIAGFNDLDIFSH